MGSMDSMVAMQNLHSGIPGIPISGIMAAGFPRGFSAAVQAGGTGASADNAKNGLNMLPMMVQGIPHPHGAAIPQHTLFSVGAMMAHTPPLSSVHASSSSSTSTSLSAAKVTTTTTTSSKPEAASPSSTTAAERESATSSGEGEKESKEEKAAEANVRQGGAEAATIITSTSRAHLGSAHLGTGAGSHITFNPFLIPGMSHGLLYPHMFLPHGGIMALPAMPPGAVDGPHSSPKRRRKRAREEVQQEEEKAATGKVEERESTVKTSTTSHSASSSSPSTPSTSAPEPGPSLTEEPQSGQQVGEDGPAKLQEPDSNHYLEEAATVETEERLEDTGGEEVEGEEKQETDKQQQVEEEEA